MNPSNGLASLAPALSAVHRLLARFGNQGMVIGGVAASLLGTPRLTADVDVVILLSVTDLPQLLAASAQCGLVPRLLDAEGFARKRRMLLLRHQGSGVNVDISLGILPFEVEAVERSTVHRVGRLSVRLPTPEDLIIFKAVAHRPQDMLDIQSIIETHTDLDRERIRYWVQEFSRVLEMPELWDDVAGRLC